MVSGEQQLLHARKEQYKCVVRFDIIDGEEWRRQEGIALRAREFSESLWQNAKNVLVQW